MNLIVNGEVIRLTGVYNAIATILSKHIRRISLGERGVGSQI